MFKLRNLCTPAMLYFFISIAGLLLIVINNINQSDNLCVGPFECSVGNRVIIYIVNAIYILFWTLILDILCKSGWNNFSWFIFLLPFILAFLFYGLIFFKFS